MFTTNCRNFKGEIEFYLNNGQNVFDSKIDSVFKSLKMKTWLCRANIKKQEGYHSAHLLFILFMLPLLQLKTIHSYCRNSGNSGLSAEKTPIIGLKRTHNIGGGHL